MEVPPLAADPMKDTQPLKKQPVVPLKKRPVVLPESLSEPSKSPCDTDTTQLKLKQNVMLQHQESGLWYQVCVALVAGDLRTHAATLHAGSHHDQLSV